MDKRKPLILISNDDGYAAKGINSLVAMVRDLATCWSVRPIQPVAVIRVLSLPRYR